MHSIRKNYNCPFVNCMKDSCNMHCTDVFPAMILHCRGGPISFDSRNYSRGICHTRGSLMGSNQLYCVCKYAVLRFFRRIPFLLCTSVNENEHASSFYNPRNNQWRHNSLLSIKLESTLFYHLLFQVSYSCLVPPQCNFLYFCDYWIGDFLRDHAFRGNN